MLYDKPVRELLVDAVAAMPTPFQRGEMVAWFKRHYPSVKPNTVTAHITAAIVNSASRFHYPSADQHLIYQRADGSLERYDSSRHGTWSPNGELVAGTALVLPRTQVDRSHPSVEVQATIDNGRAFETHARAVCSDRWGVPLRSAIVEIAPSVSHEFDLVSLDAKIVGDAKWFKNLAVPAAKWSVIAEYVWLLQRVNADRRFLIFGQDIEVPERWLTRFKPLIDDIEFYFLDHDNTMSRLA